MFSIVHLKKINRRINSISIMISLVFALIVISVLNGVSARHRHVVPDDRIVGGRPADIQEFPFEVSIQYMDEHNCGGSILAPNYVLTAAHCFDGVNANETFVRAGSTLILEGGVLIDVEEIITHPNFSFIFFDGYDVAVLRLKTNLTYGDKVQPVKLPVLAPNSQGSSVLDGSVATLAGWGAAKDMSLDMSKHLMTVNLPIVSHAQCASDLPQDGINIREICAGTTEGGKDACLGDSGGPLTLNGVQIGIVSWGRGCAQPNKPGVYASLYAKELRDFITKTTGV
ncbi:trypsin-7-like [Harmonia axyridis]|uniref:trypsin-7-like n=1 Tax=Harmonia axyridis TaxID=115357 RepID=UPI001E277A60|nr:trypsin-7-like [Harmonia axyridis]